MVRIYAGDLPTAEQHAENAIRLSPLDEKIFLPLCALGYCYLFSGRYREAIAVARKALVGRQRPPMAYRSSCGFMASPTTEARGARNIGRGGAEISIKGMAGASCFVRHDQRLAELRSAQLRARMSISRNAERRSAWLAGATGSRGREK
jgi:hypothetical protein